MTVTKTREQDSRREEEGEEEVRATNNSGLHRMERTEKKQHRLEKMSISLC